MSSGKAPHAGVGEEWTGASALAGGKGYMQCRLGALHYRRLRGQAGGERATPILLLHQTPFGLAEWVDIQPLLADMGFDTIAPDNPGYGMSDPPPDSVTIADLANNLADLLDGLSVERVAVAGHHTGAAIAASFAARHPDRTASVVLHGCPVYSAAERESRLAQAAPQVSFGRTVLTCRKPSPPFTPAHHFRAAFPPPTGERWARGGPASTHPLTAPCLQMT